MERVSSRLCWVGDGSYRPSRWASAEEFSVRAGGDRGMYRDGGDYRTSREFVERSRERLRRLRGLHRGRYKDRGSAP